MKKGFIKEDDGTIRAEGKLKGWATNYQMAVKEYLTLWDELFEKAQEKDEFQFIFALLRVKGIVGPGWDTFENTIYAFETAMKAANKIDGKINIMLWLYGHIVEANDHYEIIANMVNIAGGGTYRAWNFSNIPRPTKQNPKATREQTPNEKILEIRNRCKKLGLKDYSKPFEEVLDKKLRNAIFHSDYSTHMGMVRFVDSDTGFPVEYDAETTNLKVNQALALHETIKNLFNAYTASYTEPKIIDASPGFSPTPMKAQVIVRKKHGVMAIQESPINPGSFAAGIYKPGEKKKIEQGIFLLPRSGTDAINDLAARLPRPLARKLISLYGFIHRNDDKTY